MASKSCKDKCLGKKPTNNFHDMKVLGIGVFLGVFKSFLAFSQGFSSFFLGGRCLSGVSRVF